MAIYTKLTEKNLKEFFLKYNLGELVNYQGIEEGIPTRSNEETVFGSASGRTVRKLPDWSPMIVRAGGGAGGFSAILEGWVPGAKGSTPLTHLVSG